MIPLTANAGNAVDNSRMANANETKNNKKILKKMLTVAMSR